MMFRVREKMNPWPSPRAAFLGKGTEVIDCSDVLCIRWAVVMRMCAGGKKSIVP